MVSAHLPEVQVRCGAYEGTYDHDFTIGSDSDVDVPLTGTSLPGQSVRVTCSDGVWWFEAAPGTMLRIAGIRVTSGLVGRRTLLVLGADDAVSVLIEQTEAQAVAEGPGTYTTSPWPALRRFPGRRAVVVALGMALVCGGLAWLLHVGVIATRFGSFSQVPVGSAVAGRGNRVFGSINTLVWTSVVGFVLTLVLASGPRLTSVYATGRAQFVRVALAGAGRLGKSMVELTAGLTALMWLALHTWLMGRAGAAPSVSVALVLLVALSTVLGDSTARVIGRSSHRLGVLPDRPAVSVGESLLLGMVIGVSMQALLTSGVVVVIVAAVLLALSSRGIRGFVAGAGAVAVLAVICAPHLAGQGGVAVADDGGWVECGSSLTGYVGCPGSERVLQDAGHAVPSGAVGGAVGSLVATGVIGTLGVTRRRSPGSGTDHLSR